MNTLKRRLIDKLNANELVALASKVLHNGQRHSFWDLTFGNSETKKDIDTIIYIFNTLKLDDQAILYICQRMHYSQLSAIKTEVEISLISPDWYEIVKQIHREKLDRKRRSHL